jgi:NAD(P)H-flavin reductase
MQNVDGMPLQRNPTSHQSTNRLFSSHPSLRHAHLHLHLLLNSFPHRPLRQPPQWSAYETLILISASTGASFTLPILESVLNKPGCVQRIKFLLVARQRSEVDFYEKRLAEVEVEVGGSGGVSLDVEIAVTGGELEDENRDEHDAKNQAYTLTGSHSTSNSTPSIIYTYTRPSLPTYIRAPVEATGGETAVAVCGGKSLVAAVRNSVAALSDERAVHKWTGAQGIHLHVEEYCF